MRQTVAPQRGTWIIEAMLGSALAMPDFFTALDDVTVKFFLLCCSLVRAYLPTALDGATLLRVNDSRSDILDMTLGR